MKTSAKYFTGTVLIAVMMVFYISLSAKAKAEVVTIQTSAVCESCKARIEKALKSTDGIMEANLNLDNKKIKVKYNPEKTSPDQIRAVIANTGYDADNVKRTTEGFNKLPHCCQKGGAACEHKE
jgi:periplasmic mercuric ion binding protein